MSSKWTTTLVSALTHIVHWEILLAAQDESNLGVWMNERRKVRLTRIRRLNVISPLSVASAIKRKSICGFVRSTKKAAARIWLFEVWSYRVLRLPALVALAWGLRG